MPNTWHTEAQGPLAEALSRATVSAARLLLQLRHRGQRGGHQARPAHGHEPGRYKIITFEGGFHGRTYAALTATAQPKYHDGLEPLVAGLRLRALRRPGRRRRACSTTRRRPIMIEPIQGEGRRQHPADGFLAGLRKLSDEHGLLLIFDEVQTGWAAPGDGSPTSTRASTPDIMTWPRRWAAASRRA